MNNKTLLSVIGGLVVGFVIGFVIGFLVFHSSATFQGATVTPSNAQDSQALTNELQAIVNPELGWLATSTTMNTLTVGSTTVQSSTFTLTGASVGDYLEWSESVPTTNVNLNCVVSASNTVVCTKTTALPGSAGISAVTSTINVLDLPKSTFVSPVQANL